MNLLFIHSWQGFSLAEWYLKKAVSDHCRERVDFHSLDLPSNHIPANDTLLRNFFHLNPDLVGFSCFYWNLDACLEMARWIKQVRPSVITVFGGPQVHSVHAAEKLLSGYDAADFVVRGEGEEALVGLVEMIRLTGPVGPDLIPGLSYREGKVIRHNRESAPGEGRSLIFSDRNRELVEQLSRLDEVSYETVKGCYEKCAFCYYPTTRFGMVDDELVRAELAFLCRQQVRNLRICDTHFGGTAHRAKKILAHLAKHNRGSCIRIYPDLRHVDAAYIALLKEAGALITSISIQSTNPGVLKKINRRPVHHLTAQIELVLKHFPEVPADLIIGLPGDSYTSVRQTFNDVLDLGFSSVNLFRLMLFPGTAMYEKRSEYFEEDTLMLSHEGQVMASSDFPVEVQGRLSHLMLAMEKACAGMHQPARSGPSGRSGSQLLDQFEE